MKALGNWSVSGRSKERLASVVVFALFVSGWEAIIRYFDVQPYVAPAPSAVAQALWSALNEDLSSSAGLYVHTFYTVGEALSGYVVGAALGILLGTAISLNRFVERVLFPYILALQCLPKVAIAPLLVVWFSTGFLSKVVIVAMLTFFPLLVNSIAGFESVNRDQIELMRSFRSTRWQIFTKIKFPNALPFIFAGLNMAIIYSLIGALVGEFLGARRGLGVLILQMNINLDMAGVFAVFVVLTAAGMLMYGSMRWLERRVTFWANRPDGVTGF